MLTFLSFGTSVLIGLCALLVSLVTVRVLVKP